MESSHSIALLFIKLDSFAQVNDLSSPRPPPQPLCCASHTATTATTATTTRASRKDKHLRSASWPLRFIELKRRITGAIFFPPALPPFPYDTDIMENPIIPAMPRVISPSPTPSERDAADKDKENYFPPTTRSAARKRLATPQPVPEDLDEDESPDLRRARTRSRSPLEGRRLTRLTTKKTPSKAANGHTPVASLPLKSDVAAAAPAASAPDEKKTNGHLSPPGPSTFGGWNWRDFSRSPSPLGLIPIHRHWRTFVHKHEIPRKALHVSIGFFVVWLYLSGTQTLSVCPYLMGALIPITAVDLLRHNYAPFNRFYVRVLGALMRESEFNGYNGVIFYLLGAWAVLYFFPKDVGVVGILLLSWCDTAASTFGRLYGRYTPRIRRGKSLAGSLAAFFVGVGTAAWFWGWLVPTMGPFPGDEAFMFTGSLHLPQKMAEAVGLTTAQATISGGLALGVMSVWSGLVAATSEVADIFGWDDNLTIPVLSGLGIWGFLKMFG